MTIIQLVDELKQLNEDYKSEPHLCHIYKTKALLEYIDSDRATREFNKGYLYEP